jgi:DedD protein
MERQTKHRILGILVVIGLVIILLPLFQGGKEVSSETALVKAPPFPDQSVQVTSTGSGQQSLSQQPVAVQQAATSTQDDTSINQQPDDVISVSHPSVVNNQTPAVTANENKSVQSAAISTPNPDTTAVSSVPAQDSNNSASVPVAQNQSSTVQTANAITAAPAPSVSDGQVSKTSAETAIAKPETVKSSNYRIIEGVKAASLIKGTRHVAKRNHNNKIQAKSAVITASAAPSPVDEDGLLKLKSAAWVIQIGSFKNKANALRVVNQLRANGYKAFIQQISTALGDHTRVFVGPENKRTSARALADKLQNEMHIQGIVISYKPLTL